MVAYGTFHNAPFHTYIFRSQLAKFCFGHIGIDDVLKKAESVQFPKCFFHFAFIFASRLGADPTGTIPICSGGGGGGGG